MAESRHSPEDRGSGLEREAEHHLRDPHEPGLGVDLAEVRVAEGVAALQRADVWTRFSMLSISILTCAGLRAEADVLA